MKLRNDEIELINEFSKRLDNEIDTTIKGGANYLSALGLSCYTEYVGGLFRKKLEQGESKKNYEEGLKRMGNKYADLVKKISGDDSMYVRIRCGLVHEYFIKKTSIIWLEKEPPTGCGIEVDDENKINFYPRKYFNDLKEVIEELKRQSKKDPKFVKYISNTLPFLDTIHASGCASTLPNFNLNSESF